ncbi:TspO/MBR family protein [Nocardia sp. NPDC048505]|uniref:TspO/MBR family protein n=1 Tax=unclassified Nocardia TaxID=2637762 RepID=UPI0033CF0CF1
MSTATSANLRTTAAWVGAAAVIGSLASGPGGQWYRRLDKPAFQPPPVVFPIAWTLLYADIAATTALALDHTPDPAERRATRRALAANLVLNAGWTWLFFRAHRLGAATAGAAALTASGADLTRRVAAAHPRGRLLAPYPAWCAFATVLSASIWRRNRH